MSKEFNTVVSDFDGTLADNKGAVSSLNVDAGKEWVSKDNNLIVATGAQFGYVKDFCQVVPVLAVVAEGGAKTLSPQGEILSIETLDPEIVRTLRYELKQREIPYFAEADDVIFSPDGEALFCTDSAIFRTLEKMPDKGIIRVELWPEINDRIKIKSFIEDISRNSLIKVERAFTNHPPYQEAWQITSSRATKFHGIKNLSHPKINPDQTAVIGNGENDIILFQNTDFAVAIGDSPQKVKRAAKAVTLKQKENAVAHVLRRLMEKRR